MNVKIIGFLICMFIVLSIFSGCWLLFPTVNYLDEPKDENRSLVIGYLDMEEAPSDVYNVYMIQLDAEINSAAYRNGYPFAVNKGLEGYIFFNSYVKPGIYRFKKFKGGGGNIVYNYNFPPQGKKEMDPVITEPGIYFVGSYKYKKLNKRARYGNTEFDIVKIEKPTEKEVLEEMLKYAKNTSWEKRILKRIEELSR